MGKDRIPRKYTCTCDENCDEPCRACNRPTVQAARIAYRMGRKDARRYIYHSFGEARTDSATVDALAALLWSAYGDGEQDPFEVIGEHRKTKLRLVVREVLSRIVEAARRHLDTYPDEPVSFEAIAAAAEMDEIK